MSRVMIILALALGFIGLPALASAEVQVQVEFSERLADIVGKIDDVEQQREGYFRDHSVDQFNRRRSTLHMGNSLFSHTEWAGETLIPELENYSTENLIKTLVVESMKRAGVEFDGTIQIKLERLKVSNHSVRLIANGNTFAKGSITAIDSAGRVVGSAEISANLVLDYTNEISYNGPDFAFVDTDPESRIGPVLAYFVRQALGKLFPAKDFPRAIVIKF